MRSDPGRRFADALQGLEPDLVATGRARAACLEQIPRRAAPRRGRIPAGLAAALIVAGVGMGAGALPRPFDETPAVAHRDAGPRARDVVLHAGVLRVAIGGGPAWTRRATSVEHSPAGLFLAYGERGALVAAERDGDIRWRHPVIGTVVAIDWAPYPTYIAYIVLRDGAHELRVIWANGANDRLIARRVAPGPLGWRADTGAVRFAWSDGRGAVWEREPDRIVTRGARR